MASKMLGRTACPECGFPHAHVKQKEGEGTRAYRYCPDCGSQYYARSDAQHQALVSKLVHPVVPVGPGAEPTAPAPAPAPAADTPPVADTPPESKGYKMVLGVRVPL